MVQRIGMSVGIIEEVQRITAVSLSQKLASGIVIGMLSAVDCLGGTDSICIISVADGVSASAGSCESAALLPSEGPPGAIVVARRVADGIVSDALPINCGQQIFPTLCITIGVGMAVARQNIANRIIGVVVGGAACCLGQLALIIIGIRHRSVYIGIGGNIAHAVVGVTKGLIRGQIVGQRCYLCSGLSTGDVPVGIGLAVYTAGDRTQPPQTVITHG